VIHAPARIGEGPGKSGGGNDGELGYIVDVGFKVSPSNIESGYKVLQTHGRRLFPLPFSANLTLFPLKARYNWKFIKLNKIFLFVY
jgi:hypothetical protein